MDKSSIQAFLWTYLVLLVLLAITVATAYINLGPGNTLIGLGIAFAKAFLIALFFMHLRDNRAVVRLFSGIGLFWLLLLFGLSMSDYMTRSLNASLTGTAQEYTLNAPSEN